MSDDDRPEILDTDAEREILYQRLVDQAARSIGNSMRPAVLSAAIEGVLDATVEDGVHAIAGVAVVSMLARLRVMSGRQLAVLLAGEANRREGWIIHEPPRYTAAEIENVS